MIYRAHDASHHPLRDEIEELLEQSNCLKVFFFYSVKTSSATMDASVKPIGVRLSPKHSSKAVEKDVDDKLSVNMAYSAYSLDKIIPNKQANFYICGPQTFNSQTIEFLLELNVSVDNIFCETFGPLKV